MSDENKVYYRIHVMVTPIYEKKRDTHQEFHEGEAQTLNLGHVNNIEKVSRFLYNVARVMDEPPTQQWIERKVNAMNASIVKSTIDLILKSFEGEEEDGQS